MISMFRSGVSGLLLFCEVQIDDPFFLGKSQFFFPFVLSPGSGSFLEKIVGLLLIKGVSQKKKK